MQAQKAGGSPDFTYGWIMIDKSKTEIAAVRLLTLAGNAKGHLLCYFHFLQDWERFLVSKESGVSSKEDKNSIMVALAELAGCGSEAVFKAKVGPVGQWAVRRHRPAAAMHVWQKQAAGQGTGSKLWQCVRPCVLCT